jgi:hypothetical protein
MKKVLLLLLFNFFIVIIVHAQIQPQQPIFPHPFDTSAFDKYKRHELIDSLRKQLFPKSEPYSYRMPVAGSMPKKFIYLGNNKNGFDIYKTMQDNMYILKPDSTFVSNMPVIKMPVGEGKRN